MINGRAHLFQQTIIGTITRILQTEIKRHNIKSHLTSCTDHPTILLAIKITALYTGSWKANITSEFTPKYSITLLWLIVLAIPQYNVTPNIDIGIYSQTFPTFRDAKSAPVQGNTANCIANIKVNIRYFSGNLPPRTELYLIILLVYTCPQFHKRLFL